MVWNKTPQFCVLTIRPCLMWGRDKNINLVRNPTEQTLDICCRDHQGELQRLSLTLEEKTTSGHSDTQTSVLRGRKALNAHRKKLRGKKDSISYTLYQDAVSIWIAAIFLLASNNSVSWLYYVLLATVLKLFYNSGKKRHLRNLLSKPPVRLKKSCQSKFSFPFLLFSWQAGQGLFSFMLQNLIIYIHKKIDGTNHLSRMTHHCLSKCHKCWQANYNHETH